MHRYFLSTSINKKERNKIKSYILENPLEDNECECEICIREEEILQKIIKKNIEDWINLEGKNG